MKSHKSISISQLLLLFSTLALLCLFFSPSKIILLLMVLIFIGANFIIFKSKYKISEGNKVLHLISFITSLFVLYIGFDSFITVWTPSRKVQAVANLLHLSKPVLLYSVALLGCAVGLFATFYFSCVVIKFAYKELIKLLPVKDRDRQIKNTLINIPFLISVSAFFCLNLRTPSIWIPSFLLSIFIWIIVSSQCSSIMQYCIKKEMSIKILAFLSTLGTAWYYAIHFYSVWFENEKALALANLLSLDKLLIKIIAIIGAIVSMYFLFAIIIFVLDNIFSIIKKGKVFENIKGYEIFFYVSIIIITISFATYSFVHSEAFWGTKYSYDIIYTSDSPYLVKNNVFLDLFNAENDLRQPLFAIFSIPFMGIPYLLSRIVNASDCIQAILMNSMQICLLFFSSYLIAKLLDLSVYKRMLFLSICCSTYTYLLSSIMMEQYITAYFWLILAVFTYCKLGKASLLSTYGATSSLLTSAITFPLSLDINNALKNIKDFSEKLIIEGMGFVVLMLSFLRLDVIKNLFSKIQSLIGFSGESVPFSSKVFQFFQFLHDCFFAPNAGIDYISEEYVSWQLSMPKSINFVGVCILAIVIVSTYINRKQPICVVSSVWVAFSIVMLFILGWGTQENGLILYSLYFSWAYLVLIFKLIEKFEQKIKKKYIVPIFAIIAIAIMLEKNIPAIIEMVNFAICNYPY